MENREKAHKALGTLFGVGFAKFAPGTVGSAVAAILFFLLHLHWIVAVLSIIILFFAGIKSADVLEKVYEKDASCIVIDELVGMWIALLFIPHDLYYFFAAFVLFRFFDISKILFVRKLEQLGGGLGVMADDVLAGIYANLLIQAFIYFQ